MKNLESLTEERYLLKNKLMNSWFNDKYVNDEWKKIEEEEHKHEKAEEFKYRRLISPPRDDKYTLEFSSDDKPDSRVPGVTKKIKKAKKDKKSKKEKKHRKEKKKKDK